MRRPYFLLLCMALLSVALPAQELFWESPQVLVQKDASFIQSSSGGGVSVLLWHEFGPEQEGGYRELYISLLSGSKGRWDRRERVLGPFPYVGDEVPVASLLLDRRGTVYIALASSGNTIKLFRSDDEGESFTLIAEPGLGLEESSIVAPRLFLSDDGSLLLFVTRPLISSTDTALASDTSLGSAYARSSDGRNWSDFQPLVGADSGLSYVYLPYHDSFQGRDYVVFQAQPPESRFYQLYLTESRDDGRSWSSPVRISDFSETQMADNPDPDAYDNQRPVIYGDRDRLHLTWERRYSGTTAPQVYYALIDEGGNLIGESQKVSRGFNSCRNPSVIQAYDRLILQWFDDRKGENRVFLAVREGLEWSQQDLSIMNGVSAFPRSFIEDGELYIAWENSYRDRKRLVFLAPDRTVPSPAIQPLDFRAAFPARRDRFSIRWNLPDDSSGIAGFSFSLDRDPRGEPPRRMMLLRRDERRFSSLVEEDGSWYFHVRATDYAGNWSDVAHLEAVRDTTPPSPVVFELVDGDGEGYLPSNTWTLRWQRPEEEDLAGYSYRLQYLAQNSFSGDLERLNIADPREILRTRESQLSFRNIDNGIWGLSVAPIDRVGNVGEPREMLFRLNKYIPVTYITNLDVEEDELNRYRVSIRGRGFAVGGMISEIYLDRDGQAPYDYTFSLESASYRVVDDRRIEGPFIEDIDGGNYYIGLLHPERGRYFSRRALSFSDTGTVKFGDFTIFEKERAPLIRLPFRSLSAGRIGFVLVMVLLGLGALAASVKLFSLVREGLYLRAEAVALIENRAMPHEERKERIQEMKKEQKGLRFKFSLLITFLVLVIVMLVSLPLGRFMIKTQQENLTAGLQQSTRVLVESIAAGAAKYLPEENTLELGRLPVQSKAFGDARYVSISGPASSQYQGLQEDYYDYLWASNDPDLSSKLIQDEEEEGDGFRRGGAVIKDDISVLIPRLEKEINQKARSEVGALSEELIDLQRQAREAASRLVSNRDRDTAQLLQELQDGIADLNREIEEKLRLIGDRVQAVPDFDADSILTGPDTYTVYRPVVYQDSSKPEVFFHGLIRLGISTERIKGVIISSREQLVYQTALIAAGAVLLGIIGALLLATIIIIPIRKLVRGVEVISETEDKEKLKDHIIKVKSRDEIAQLAETINGMTQGLVKAAAASKDLTIGKEVQKMFIPLDEDERGNKLTTGADDFSGVRFFGYYEGAKGVSGDYFDYLELPGNLYAMIKCDVAGKGVPASLIMVEVATIFRNYLNEWKLEQERLSAIARSKGIQPKKREPAIEKLVASINGLVQERGFKGRFAALIVVLIDGDSGKTLFCNAGDNLVHVFKSAKKTMEMLTLPQAPAAGVFPNDLVEMRGGFAKVGQKLESGDRLFLYTDGLEEAQRKFRDAAFQVITCQEAGLESGELHDTHPVGNDNEELGNPRIYEIIDTYYAGGVYRLHKYHNAIADEKLEFDFSGCDGSVEEAVLALVSVEKVFRIYPDSRAGGEDQINVDSKIDSFLERVFLQYSGYFPRDRRSPSKREGFWTYTHLKEDEQYDDLTVLAVEKA